MARRYAGPSPIIGSAERLFVRKDKQRQEPRSFFRARGWALKATKDSTKDLR